MHFELFAFAIAANAHKALVDIDKAFNRAEENVEHATNGEDEGMSSAHESNFIDSKSTFDPESN